MTERISNPLVEFGRLLTGVDGLSHRGRTSDCILTIRALDEAVENGCEEETARCWRVLASIGEGLEKRSRPIDREIGQLREYERWEKALRSMPRLSLPLMRRVLFLKSSDLGVYRRALADDLGLTPDTRAYDALRACDVFRELVDDVADIDEDLKSPNFNFAIWACLAVEDWASYVLNELECLAGRALSSLSQLARTGVASPDWCRGVAVQLRHEERDCRQLILSRVPEGIGPVLHGRTRLALADQ